MKCLIEKKWVQICMILTFFPKGCLGKLWTRPCKALTIKLNRNALRSMLLRVPSKSLNSRSFFFSNSAKASVLSDDWQHNTDISLEAKCSRTQNLRAIKKCRTDKSWKEKVSKRILRTFPPNWNAMDESITMVSMNLASKWMEGVEVKLSMANFDVVPWGSNLWMLSTVVAMPKIKTKGRWPLYSLKRKYHV